MKKKVKFVCRFDSSNVGDDNCSPLRFFDFEDFETEKIVFADYRSDYRSASLKKDSNDRFIIGGGLFDIKHLRYFSHSRKIVFWGGGIRDIQKNKSFFTGRQKKLPNLKNSLYGVRDYGYVDHWVPCVSCMSPLFDNPAPVENEYVVFEHHHRSIDLPFPKRTNTGISFEEALHFLSSAENVITNSYHGAYWSILLGKKVFLKNEINNKTRTFKWPPVYCADSEWKNPANAVSYPGALEEARRVNLLFRSEVLEFMAT